MPLSISGTQGRRESTELRHHHNRYIFTLDKRREMSPPPLLAFPQLPRFKSMFLFLKKSHHSTILFSLLLFHPIIFRSSQEIIVFRNRAYCRFPLTLYALLQLLQLFPFSVRIIINTINVTAERQARMYKNP